MPDGYCSSIGIRIRSKRNLLQRKKKKINNISSRSKSRQSHWPLLRFRKNDFSNGSSQGSPEIDEMRNKGKRFKALMFDVPGKLMHFEHRFLPSFECFTYIRTKRKFIRDQLLGMDWKISPC
ncbi:ATP synthase subunit [Dirofilaria immitis]